MSSEVSVEVGEEVQAGAVGPDRVVDSRLVAVGRGVVGLDDGTDDGLPEESTTAPEMSTVAGSMAAAGSGASAASTATTVSTPTVDGVGGGAVGLVGVPLGEVLADRVGELDAL